MKPQVQGGGLAHGAAGGGGVGGDGDATVKGADGQSCTLLDFGSGACTP
ncbi:MAG TPA: hypothetical protein VHF26_20240 [Trebonia sp.]|nr:hypothetical protein [Trebonia sp.]